MRGMASIVLVFCLLLAGSLEAREIAGVNFPDQYPVGDKTLVLNGVGLRKKLIIKVYAGGLYVPQQSGDAKAIWEADQPMALRMVFIHDGVEAKKLVDAWNDGFKAATGGNMGPIQAQIDAFNALFTQTAKKGDVYEYVYAGEKGTSVIMNGEVKGVIPGLPFKQALFGIWLGESPADANLKKGLLGQ